MSVTSDTIDYKIELIDPSDDLKPYIDFLLKFFFRDEPLNYYLDLTSGDCRILELHAREMLETAGINLKVLCNGKLIGLCLNEFMERSVANENNEPVGHKKLDLILNLIGKVHQEANEFSKYPDVNKALSLNILSVDPAYRGKGIAKNLIINTIGLAKDNKCGFISVTSSSYFTECALKRLGFEECSRIKFSDYKGLDGEPLNLTSPNEYMCVYTLRTPI